MSVFKFFCRECGPLDDPCSHILEHQELKLLREIYADNIRCCKTIIDGILAIIALLKRPQSATLFIVVTSPAGDFMPKIVAPGGTGQAVFQEWSGPNGTGTVVPNEGPVAFSSDNPAVATVDPATGLITSVGPEGVANISGVDGKNNLTASDVFTVKIPPPPPPPAVSATLQIT